MIPAQFDYLVPATLTEALQILSSNRDGAKLLAGGHSLIPLMKLRIVQPSTIIDMRNLSELRGISQSGDRISIGAMTTHSDLANSPLLQQQAPALAQAAQLIGDRQVRARGTIGGSLAHADPAADLPAAMLVLDAVFAVRSSRGDRTIAAGDFFRGLLETALEPDELLTTIQIKAAPRSAYMKLPNPASHYAIVGVAVALEGEGNSSSARIGVTGAANNAYRALAAEAALGGKALSAESIAQAASQTNDGRELLADIWASSEYRASMIVVMTQRALEKVL